MSRSGSLGREARAGRGDSTERTEGRDDEAPSSASLVPLLRSEVGDGVFDLHLPPLDLEAGGRIAPHVVRGWSSGPAEAPVILIVHALTGDARVDRWWGPVVGPGRALDPTRFRLLCFNLLGSCYGSAGPGSRGFPVGDVQLTTWDQARSILLALDALRIERVHLVVGGSLGGMVSLCLAALEPTRFERVAPIAAAAAASAWVVGFNHVARQVIRLDPGFPARADRGLSLARQLAMLTYRAEPGLEQRQPRPVEPPWTLHPAYPIRGYLEHQGTRLVQRFDPRSYLSLLDAMDHHDLARRPPGVEEGEPQEARRLRGGGGGQGRSRRLAERGSEAERGREGDPWRQAKHGLEEASRRREAEAEDLSLAWGVRRITASLLAVSIDSDRLFCPEQIHRLVRALQDRGAVAEEAMLTSAHGHDAFLVEWNQVAAVLERALDLPAGHR